MAGASIEMTVELWATYLRVAEARLRGLVSRDWLAARAIDMIWRAPAADVPLSWVAVNAAYSVSTSRARYGIWARLCP